MSLLHIHTASGHGKPMVAHGEIEVVTGKGLVGDRDYGRTRQVTLVCTGELEAAAATLGVDAIPPGSTRRNLTVDLPELPRTYRTQVRVSEVLLEVRRDCPPCLVMNESIIPGAEHALVGRGGVSAHVLAGGVIRVGDTVEIRDRTQ